MLGVMESQASELSVPELKHISVSDSECASHNICDSGDANVNAVNSCDKINVTCAEETPMHSENGNSVNSSENVDKSVNQDLSGSNDSKEDSVTISDTGHAELINQTICVTNQVSLTTNEAGGDTNQATTVLEGNAVPLLQNDTTFENANSSDPINSTPQDAKVLEDNVESLLQNDTTVENANSLGPINSTPCQDAPVLEDHVEPLLQLDTTVENANSSEPTNSTPVKLPQKGGITPALSVSTNSESPDADSKNQTPSAETSGNATAKSEDDIVLHLSDSDAEEHEIEVMQDEDILLNDDEVTGETYAPEQEPSIASTKSTNSTIKAPLKALTSDGSDAAETTLPEEASRSPLNETKTDPVAVPKSKTDEDVQSRDLKEISEMQPILSNDKPTVDLSSMKDDDSKVLVATNSTLTINDTATSPRELEETVLNNQLSPQAEPSAEASDNAEQRTNDKDAEEHDKNETVENTSEACPREAPKGGNMTSVDAGDSDEPPSDHADPVDLPDDMFESAAALQALAEEEELARQQAEEALAILDQSEGYMDDDTNDGFNTGEEGETHDGAYLDDDETSGDVDTDTNDVTEYANDVTEDANDGMEDTNDICITEDTVDGQFTVDDSCDAVDGLGTVEVEDSTTGVHVDGDEPADSLDADDVSSMDIGDSSCAENAEDSNGAVSGINIENVEGNKEGDKQDVENEPKANLEASSTEGNKDSEDDIGKEGAGHLEPAKTNKTSDDSDEPSSSPFADISSTNSNTNIESDNVSTKTSPVPTEASPAQLKSDLAKEVDSPGDAKNASTSRKRSHSGDGLSEGVTKQRRLAENEVLIVPTMPAAPLKPRAFIEVKKVQLNEVNQRLLKESNEREKRRRLEAATAAAKAANMAAVGAPSPAAGVDTTLRGPTAASGAASGCAGAKPADAAVSPATLNGALRSSLLKNVKRLSREQLESLVLEKMCEAISSRSVIGEMRRAADRHDTAAERFQKKITYLQKQVGDLHLVVRKLTAELKTRRTPTFPVKITRTVGLQVTLAKNIPPLTSVGRGRSSSMGSSPTAAMRSPGAAAPAAGGAARGDGTALRAQLTRPPVMQHRGVPTMTPIPVSRGTVYVATTAVPQVGRGSPARPPNPVLSPHRRVLPTSIGGVPVVRASSMPLGTVPLPQRTPAAVGGQQVLRQGAPMLYSARRRGRPPRLQLAPAAAAASKNSSAAAGASGGGGAAAAVVDLTDDDPAPPARADAAPSPRRNLTTITALSRSPAVPPPVRPLRPVGAHPAPFPITPPNPVVSTRQLAPPPPELKVTRRANGIVLSWTMDLTPRHASVVSYHLFAYQQAGPANPRVNPWKKVGDVKALPLPMACTLTQFQEGHKYHFAVRAEDSFRRRGPFSNPSSIALMGS